MTIDERLQALTETVEILAGMQMENEKRQKENEESIKALAAMQQRTFELVSGAVTSLAASVDRTTRNMEILIRYAQRHEDWLDEIDKKLDGGAQ
jgi:uncharacterized coiled-coil protein SlyX